MELPQPRPLGTQCRKATLDFLSLCSSPAATHGQQDPAPSQGDYLKTHDFLQPLERVGKTGNSTVKENTKAIVISSVERPPKEHLPGGTGTYSISYFDHRLLNPEGNIFSTQSRTTSWIDDNLKCSSHTGSGFTPWDEISTQKGKTGKENIAARTHVSRDANVGGGRSSSLFEKPSQSSSSYKHNISNFSSFTSSQPFSSEKNQSFMEMMIAENNHEDVDDGCKLVIKKEASPNLKDNLPIKVEAKTTDQKPNTPRSKHSATEQRRRTKINDRFQKLREITPSSDQKRDKASFLLEVIEYIQFLQEKLNRYATSYYDRSNNEPPKIMHLQNSSITEDFLDPATSGYTGSSCTASVCGRKFGGNRPCGYTSLSIDGQNLVDLDISTATTIKERLLTSNAAQTQSNIFSFAKASIVPAPPVPPKQQPSHADRTMMWLPSTNSHKMKNQELAVERGPISISSVYSQGLLNTLTQSLRRSGVDISEASISVQIELGKRASCVQRASTFPTQADDVSATLPHSRAASAGEEYGHIFKRLRTS